MEASGDTFEIIDDSDSENSIKQTEDKNEKVSEIIETSEKTETLNDIGEFFEKTDEIKNSNVTNYCKDISGDEVENKTDTVTLKQSKDDNMENNNNKEPKSEEESEEQTKEVDLKEDKVKEDLEKSESCENLEKQTETDENIKEHESNEDQQKDEINLNTEEPAMEKEIHEDSEKQEVNLVTEEQKIDEVSTQQEICQDNEQQEIIDKSQEQKIQENTTNIDTGKRNLLVECGILDEVDGDKALENNQIGDELVENKNKLHIEGQDESQKIEKLGLADIIIVEKMETSTEEVKETADESSVEKEAEREKENSFDILETKEDTMPNESEQVQNKENIASESTEESVKREEIDYDNEHKNKEENDTEGNDDVEQKEDLDSVKEENTVEKNESVENKQETQQSTKPQIFILESLNSTQEHEVPEKKHTSTEHFEMVSDYDENSNDILDKKPTDIEIVSNNSNDESDNSNEAESEEEEEEEEEEEDGIDIYPSKRRNPMSTVYREMRSASEDDDDDVEEEDDDEDDVEEDAEEEDCREEDDDDDDNEEEDDDIMPPKKPKYENIVDEITILSSDDEEDNDKNNLHTSNIPKMISRVNTTPVDAKPSTSGLLIKSVKGGKSRDEINYDQLNEFNDDDYETDEDYDDEELMNDVVMSSVMRKVSAAGEIYHKKSRTIDGRRLTKQIRYKKRLKRSIRQIDYRSKVKNRSIKWFCSKMLHHSNDDILVQQQMAIIDDLQYSGAKSAENKSEIRNNIPNQTQSSTATSQNKTERAYSDYENVIDLDSSTEKSFSNKADNLGTSIDDESDESLDNLENDSKGKSGKMQPLEKVRETISKNEETKTDIKEQSDKNEQKSINVDEQKKEIKNDQNKNETNDNNFEEEDIPVSEIRKNNYKEIDKEETTDKTLINQTTLELMDVSDNTTITENDKTKQNEIDVSEIKKETEDQNEPINDNNTQNNIPKTPEPPTSTKTITSNQIPQSRKRLRSQSSNDGSEINLTKNNIQMTSTPLSNANKKDNENACKENIHTASMNGNINDNEQEQLHPIKKLRAELETNFTKHDRILAEYIERTSNETTDDIDKHISQLAIEIQTLNDMIKAKEYEWNNMLHLKKVKEEICFRLTRKKQVIELMSTKLGEITNHVPNATASIDQNLLGEKLAIASQLKIPNIANIATTSSNNFNQQQQQNMTVSALAAMAAQTNLLNFSNAAATTISAMNKNKNEFSLNAINSTNSMNSSGSSSSSTAQNILNMRANMKSSDLAKERATAQKIHRNILPKPSSSSIITPPTNQHLITSSLIQSANSGGASASQLATLSGLFGSATTPVVLSNSASGGGAAVQIPLPLSNVATGSLMSAAQTQPGAAVQQGSGPTSTATSNHQTTILNNYLTAAASVQQQFGELLNGHHNPQNAQNGQNLMIGRQGVFKDVKSIIADYRQRHPEQVPRRGRRMKSTSSNDVSVGGASLGQNRLSNSELNTFLNRLEALRGNASSASTAAQNSLLNAVVAAGQQQTSNAPTSTTNNFNSTFSPTLARLLTAPERVSNNLGIAGSHQTSTITTAQAAAAAAASNASTSSGLNLSKVVAHNSEITITPVINSGSNSAQTSALQQSLLQKQIKDALNISKNLSLANDRVKSEYFMNIDDEAEDSVDRLVIDEGGTDGNGEDIHRIAPNAIGQEFHENEVPWCQGCKNQEAQFVCAGCGSQWYCSRECQVQAWDEHSETCTG